MQWNGDLRLILEVGFEGAKLPGPRPNSSFHAPVGLARPGRHIYGDSRRLPGVCHCSTQLLEFLRAITLYCNLELAIDQLIQYVLHKFHNPRFCCLARNGYREYAFGFVAVQNEERVSERRLIIVLAS